MTTVRLILSTGPFPRLIIEDRSGEVHDIELSDATADELTRLGCDGCAVAEYRFAI